MHHSGATKARCPGLAPARVWSAHRRPGNFLPPWEQAVGQKRAAANPVSRATKEGSALKTSFELGAAAGDGRFLDFKRRESIAIEMFWLKPDGLAGGSMDAQIAGRVHDGLACAAFDQDGQHSTA